MTAFIAFLAGYVLSQFYRSFLAVIAPEIAQELTLSATDLGNISAAWFVGFALSQFAVGAALDRIGPRRTVPVTMLAGVIGAVMFARANSSFDAIAAMFMIGIGCSAALMGPLFVFARTLPASRFAFMASMMIGLGSIGNLLGGTPLALAQQAFGWRGVFFTLAGIALATAAIIAILVRDPPPAPAADGPSRGLIGELGQVLSLRALWLIWPIMTVGYAILIAERGLWVGPYLSEVFGLEPVARGNVIFAMAAAITAGALAYGPLDQWFGTRKWVAFTGSALTALCFGALWFVPVPSLGATTLLLCVIGAAGMNYAVIMAHVRSYIPEHVLGRGITFANFLCMAGSGLAQVCSGIYVDHLKTTGLAPAAVYAHLHLAFALTLLGATLIYALSPEKR